MTAHLSRTFAKVALIRDRRLARADTHLWQLPKTHWRETMSVLLRVVVLTLYYRNFLDKGTLFHQYTLRLGLLHLFDQFHVDFVSLVQIRRHERLVVALAHLRQAVSSIASDKVIRPSRELVSVLSRIVRVVVNGQEAALIVAPL